MEIEGCLGNIIETRSVIKMEAKENRSGTMGTVTCAFHMEPGIPVSKHTHTHTHAQGRSVLWAITPNSIIHTCNHPALKERRFLQEEAGNRAHLQRCHGGDVCRGRAQSMEKTFQCRNDRITAVMTVIAIMIIITNESKTRAFASAENASGQTCTRGAEQLYLYTRVQRN